jgi:hypothetical protein
MHELRGRAGLVRAGTKGGSACEIAENLNAIENRGDGLAEFGIAWTFWRQNFDVAGGINGDKHAIRAAHKDSDGVAVFLGYMEDKRMVVNDFYECSHSCISFPWFRWL